MNWVPRRESSPKMEWPQVPSLLSKLLVARGVDSPEQFEKIFSPSLKDLRDPLVLDQMESAVGRLVKARRDQECVAVYADFDLDGTSGLALLEKALRDFGFSKVLHYQPLRLSEGYGLHASAVESLKALGASVVVSVDVGITAMEAGERAKELGVDLIVTDHHLPKDVLPQAFAIVNPNKGTCTSGLGHLSGAGVAFYLVLALKRELESQGLLEKGYDIKALLDVFVIGTLTDLVPLVDENRVLVKHGLVQLQRTSRPGLRYLMDRLGLLGRGLSSQDVAIQLAPKLNALSRMEMGLMPREVMLVQSESEAQALVDRIIESNEMRKYLQKEALEQARRMVSAAGSGIFVFSPEFHKGVVGLIATQLAKEFKVPAFVGSQDSEGHIHGSARIPEGSGIHLVEALGQLSSHLVRFGGHAAAAGFVVREGQAASFAENLQSVLAQMLKSTEALKVPYDTDAELGELNAQFMSWYERLEPFGKEFPPGLFRVSPAIVVERNELKGGHLRLKLRQGTQQSEGMLFHPSEQASSIGVGESIEALVEPGWNHFRGVRRLQLLIKNLKSL